MNQANEIAQTVFKTSKSVEDIYFAKSLFL